MENRYLEAESNRDSFPIKSGFHARAVPAPEVCAILKRGRISGCEPLYRGSNHVFLLTLARGKRFARAVYKPRAGERPLWDFPEGTLYKRECAACVVSQALGWFIVPPTVIRDGPYGIGSVQWFIETNSGSDYNVLRAKHSAELKRIAVFDCLVNNADRKGGHLLEGQDGRIWAIDNALSFNTVPKLRTVIWDFAGQSIPPGLIADLEAFHRALKPPMPERAALSDLLAAEEVEALERRLSKIIEHPFFPYPASYRSMPWPPF
ncbi:MAG: SCO1664 family protein [Chloroflexi bacterium]|nr:SCO1664 family protein [Chloroflexota bacterium]